MDAARIAELLRPFFDPSDPLADHQNLIPLISTYVDLLVRWNARINLTAIRNEEEIVTRHFGESLFAARHIFSARTQAVAETSVRLADVGSGAGFPGIPIKLWAPDLALTLIESNHKKAAFLSEVARALALSNVNLKNTRAEDVPETFDVVTLRAVEQFASILPVAARLLEPSARLALLISSSQVSQAHEALPHLRWSNPIATPKSGSRVLLVGAQELR
jgi:16S rRNA (guanine527-N7)-methyltransferase